MNGRIVLILFAGLYASQYLAAMEGERPVPVKEQNGGRRTNANTADSVSYASIREDVEVKSESIRNFSMQAVRPANSYQLAGAANKELCDEVLDAFNEQGVYQGPDSMFWALNNSRIVEWQPLDIKYDDLGGYPARSFGLGLEYTSVDIDGDGSEEYVYRVGSVVHSMYYQRISIFDFRLQDNVEKLAPFRSECEHVNPIDCDKISSQIISAISARYPDRIKDEWESTKSNMVSKATSDDLSRKLISPLDKNRAERNIGDGSNAYWNFYRVKSGSVAVVAPTTNFSPKEFLVFSPRRDRPGDLQCVLMPVIWRK